MKNKQLNDIQSVEMKNDLNSPEDFPATGAVPVLDYLNDSLKKTKASRRDFLKTMGFSVSAAALAASCDIPVKKAIPYVNKPENLTPGKALYYASSYFDGRNFSNILVKTRDGRPIKIEPNKSAPLHTSVSPAVQASIISLYDNNRIQKPYVNDKAATWADIDAAVATELAKTNGQIVLLTGPVISPSVKSAIASLQGKYGNLRHVVYSAHGADAVLLANEQQFGKKVAPFLNFANADVIASFSADFLGSWLGGSSFYAKDYTKNRKVSADNPHMSKHYQVESHMSLTGSNADKRIGLKPSAVKAALFQLHNMITGNNISGVPAIENADFLSAMAKDLKAARGKSLVLCGMNDVDCQKAANAINQALGNYGSTIEMGRTLNTVQGDAKEFAALVNDMKAGRVGAMLIHGANPVFSSAAGADFAEALGKVKTVVSFDSQVNETNTAATYFLPDNHYLESWNEYEPVTGNVSVAQPTIRPLFETRPFIQSLLTFAGYEFGEGKDYVDAMQSTWRNTFGDKFQETWDNAVQGGGRTVEVTAAAPSFSGSSILFTKPEAGDVELVLFEDKMGDGTHANNPYLQELPDPVSKVSWDNYAALSPRFAREMGVYVNRNVNPAKESAPMITITANGQSVELPVLVLPGVAHGVVAVPKGYGRQEGGAVGSGVGVNANSLSSVANGLKTDTAVLSAFEKSGKGAELPQAQIHYTIDDDRPTVREATLAEYKESPDAGNYFRYLPKFEHAIEPTLYPEREFPAHHWGMSVDLNACFGCGACVVSCNIENNVPVVGKKEIANQRDMHWLRIDRYFASADQDPKSDTYMEDPSVVFMPMMCQHCDNAPCENVCPVNATNHSSEGLNQMAYNRCIGTRYCANNCPFKVRRFNWFDYWGADAWGAGNDLKKNAVNEYMRHDFSRMVLNPDVTVRSRGVIEKCSFCVQKIQEAKLDAKIANKAMDANAIQTACQSACPADAITFGDTNNKASDVHNLWEDKRNYFVLEEFHVKPSVGYMTKITNSDVALFDKTKHPDFPWKKGDGSHGGGHGEEHGAAESHGGAHEAEETHGNGH